MLEDVEGNMISQTDSPGEICGRGPHVMLCYFKDPDKTEEVMLNERFHSGDIGILDEDNFITIVDRKKDMIKTGGENVPSREVEEVIYQHPNVSEVAVVGLPHEKWVEAVTAFIVPKDLENITADEIKDICQKNLASFKVPKDFIFIDELPKNPSGKLLKKNIRDQYKSYFSAQ